MSISAITIENFKGIKEPVKVEFKPITLLFGPNSAGKSTIVQALHYAREIFEHQNLNPDQTRSGGDSVDLGGFHNLVHNHDLRNSIRLRFDFSFDSDGAFIFPTFTKDFEIETPESEHYLESYWYQAEDVLEPWLEITIRWNSLLGKPFISTYKTGFGDKLFAEITVSEDGKQKAVTYLDLKSPVFLDEVGENFALPHLGPAILDEEKNVLQLNIQESKYSHISTKQTSEGVLPVGSGMAFPDLHERSPKDLEGLSIFRDTASFEGLLGSLLLSPVSYLCGELNSFQYVGPLRQVPDRKYQPKLTKSLASWAEGLAAWDKLYQADSSFIDEVNEWLCNRLGTGYTVETKQYKEIDISSPFSLALLQGNYLDEDLDLQGYFASLPVKRRLRLRDINRDITMAPSDIGVGISQIMPVIVLALSFRQGLFAIEQPELHIHPALQVALGDLFIQEIQTEKSMDEGKTFLLETHSEHLLLRFLKRIRQTTDQELPDNCSELTIDQLAVNYVESQNGKVVLTKLPVTEDGDFSEEWPSGFFEERDDELLY